MLRLLTRIMNLTEVEIMNHPVFMVNILDHQHRVLFWNKRCEFFFGIAEAKALGKRFEDIVPQAKGHQNQKYLDRALKGESLIVEYTPYQTKSGGFIQTILPLTNITGSVVAAVSITKEIQDSANETKFSFNTEAFSRCQHHYAALESYMV